MELSKKIQKLRKENNLTQEELAEKLFVTRTAISKWETGRGTPSIESLQQIANFFNVSLDSLLSSEEIIYLANNENQENIRNYTKFFEGLINILSILGILLPVYKVKIENIFYSIPLYQVKGLKQIIFLICPIILISCGILQLFNNGKNKINTLTHKLNIMVHAIEILILIIYSQPYAATLFFFLFLLKVVIIKKNLK